MNTVSDHVNFSILDERFAQIKLDFDATLGALWVRMKPSGRPCFSLSFIEEIRECQLSIQQTGGKIFKDGELHELKYVVLASDIENVFNLGGDLALFRELIESQDKEALMEYARRCVDISYHNYRNYHLPLITISLVQGEAKGGGFESALSSTVLIAEKSAKLGLPEICFNMFPGMGAYTYLARKVGMRSAEQLILSGRTYTGAELCDLGVVDVAAEDGAGEAALRDYLRGWTSGRNGFKGVMRARQRFNPVNYEELLDTTKIWVETALQISDRDMRLMDRLVRAQDRVHGTSSAMLKEVA